jgi:DNA-binding MarR family transcriptional regulator
VSSSADMVGAVERLIGSVMRQSDAVGAEPSPLSLTQAMTLRTLADHGPLRLGALARLLGTTPATASRTVDILEAMLLLRRTRDPADGRGVIVELNEAGERWVNHRREALEDMVSELRGRMRPRDQRRFTDLLMQLNDLLTGADRARL